MLKSPYYAKPRTVSGQATDDSNAKEKMRVKNQNITFDKLDKDDKIPYDLLLLADPSKDLIDEYLKQSDIFIARQNDKIFGVAVLYKNEKKFGKICHSDLYFWIKYG